MLKNGTCCSSGCSQNAKQLSKQPKPRKWVFEQNKEPNQSALIAEG